MNEEVVRVEDIINALKKRWIMILGVTLAFTVIAGLITHFAIKPEYQARIKLFIGKDESNSEDLKYNNGEISMYQNLMKTYAEIIKTKDLASSALVKINQNESFGNAGRVQAGLSVSPSADTQIMQVRYTSTNRAEILPVLNAIVDEFMIKSKELIPNGNVQIIENAEDPYQIGPNTKLNIMIGFLLGLMISVGITFLLAYLDRTIKYKDELETLLDLPVLGNIPHTDSI
ncbi:MAG: YveK family protein [Sarcina sp.]